MFCNPVDLFHSNQIQELWIGASDISQEGYYVWDNGNKPVSPGYTNWGPNAPNDVKGEDCVEYNRYSFTWNDAPCGNGYGGVCEAQP